MCVCCFSWAALDSLLTFTKIAAGRLLQFLSFGLCSGPTTPDLKSRWRMEGEGNEKKFFGLFWKRSVKDRQRETESGKYLFFCSVGSFHPNKAFTSTEEEREKLTEFGRAAFLSTFMPRKKHFEF